MRRGEARYTYEVDPRDHTRVNAQCSRAPRLRIDAARWPVQLEPWLGADLRVRALAPPWSARCKGQAEPNTALQIVGLHDGDIIQRARPEQLPVIRLELRGATGPVYWLVNGRLAAQGLGTQSFVHTLDMTGRVDITAMNDTGNFDRVSLSVRP